MKTTISIPYVLFEEAERLAKSLGITRSELYQRAIQVFLKHHADECITEALNEVYRPECEEGSLDLVLERVQTISLPKEDW